MQGEVFLDKIVSIVEVGDDDTIDISVSGNKLFFANDILTHNCGIGNADVEMSDISESIGIAATCDFILAWIRTPELDESKSVLLKIIKSRFGSTVGNLRTVVGVDYPKMTVCDLEDGTDVDDNGYITKKPDFPVKDIPWDNKKTEKKTFAEIKF